MLIMTVLMINRAIFKAWVCGCSLAGNTGPNPAGGNKYLNSLSFVCFQVEVSETS